MKIPGRRQSGSEAETRLIAAEIARHLGDDDWCLLRGNLGAGKTVFVQGMAVGLGIEPRVVQSPTFSLVHEYRAGERRLLHLDLYRLAEEDFDSSGLGELLSEDGVKAIEWAERLPDEYRRGLEIAIERLSDGRRQIDVKMLAGASDRKSTAPAGTELRE